MAIVMRAAEPKYLSTIRARTNRPHADPDCICTSAARSPFFYAPRPTPLLVRWEQRCEALGVAASAEPWNAQRRKRVMSAVSRLAIVRRPGFTGALVVQLVSMLGIDERVRLFDESGRTNASSSLTRSMRKPYSWTSIA
jgi:hypothetical protein